VTLSTEIVPQTGACLRTFEPAELCIGEECYSWYFAVYGRREKSVQPTRPYAAQRGCRGSGVGATVRANQIAGGTLGDGQGLKVSVCYVDESTSTDDVIVADNRFDGPPHGGSETVQQDRDVASVVEVCWARQRMGGRWAWTARRRTTPASETTSGRRWASMPSRQQPGTGMSCLGLPGCHRGVPSRRFVVRGGCVEVSDVTVRESWSGDHGHGCGSHSLEVQDALLRLHRELFRRRRLADGGSGG
jgi:hypothetical protein